MLALSAGLWLRRMYVTTSGEKDSGTLEQANSVALQASHLMACNDTRLLRKDSPMDTLGPRTLGPRPADSVCSNEQVCRCSLMHTVAT